MAPLASLPKVHSEPFEGQPVRMLNRRGARTRYRILLLSSIVSFSWAPSADAYPWTLQHGYRQCRACHLDPSGGGILTAYGRATTEDILAPWGDNEGAELTPEEEFLWGAVGTTFPVLLGGDVRVLRIAQKISEAPLRTDLITMQLDLEAGLDLERFVLSASLGYAPEGAGDAALTRGATDNLVSRQHWFGYRVHPELLLLRAGRMNLPYGIRNIEHTLWSRAFTRTSINDDQQYGVALSLDADSLRGEVMAVLGNFQNRPDGYRERGYSAFAEWAATDELAVGGSSLVLHRELDPRSQRSSYRHAHGVLARWSTPYRPLVLFSEWNYVLETPQGGRWRSGFVGHLQADWELTPGVHLIWTGEAHNVGVDTTPASFGSWLSYAWFIVPHADVRLDAVYQKLRSSFGDTDIWVSLAQLHLSL